MAKKYSYSSARDRAEKHQSGFDSTSIKLPDGVQLFKVKKEGIVRLDIIPFVAGAGNPYAEEGTLHYERTFHIHRGVGANSDSYICPQKTAGEKCPICEHRRKLMKDPEGDEELIKDLAPRERQLFQVIDLSDPDKGIQIWDVSYHLFGKLLDARIRDADEGDDYHMFYHLEKGLTLKIGFAEKSFGGNTFYEAETIDFKPRKEPYDAEILEKGHCLDELLKIESYDKLKAAFLQTDDDEKSKSDDDEDETPKKKSKPAPADDDDDEEPVKKKKPVADDDEDEDEAPAKKKKPVDDDDDEEPVKKKSKPAADDDDEDEDPPAKKKKASDDDDDEDPPAKKKKPAADEDDEEEAPVKKKKPADDDWDDEDEAPAKEKKAKDEDEDEDPPAKKKKPVDDDEDEDPPAKKKKPAADDDEDEDPPAKKKKPADDDWDDE